MPVPELVGERMWRAARAMQRELGVAPRWHVIGEPDGPELKEQSFRERLDRSIAAMREAGFFADVEVAEGE